MPKGYDWTKMSIEELEAEVLRHNRLYFAKHKPRISDHEFDRLVETLKTKKPDSKALTEIPTDLTQYGATVRHALPMLSLDKCYSEKELSEWASKFDDDVIASPKIDGCAVSIRYDSEGRLAQAATRGDGIEGELITANTRYIRAIPKEIDLKGVEVRGEVYMPLSVFARYKGEFANPRNLAAGAIKQKDPRKTGEYALSFFAYDLLGSAAKEEAEKLKLLKREGFKTVGWKKIGKSKMQGIFENFLNRRNEYDFETDGVVYKVNIIEEQGRLGSTAHHPRYAIAYKFQGDSGVTILKDVEWSVARTGVITPVAVVEPVELSGAMVSRASLHNVGIMKQLGITKGAKVLMMRRGGVIPKLESVVEPGRGAIEIPRRCPSCGSPTLIEDDFLYCTTPKSCVKSKMRELEHFVKVVGIEGFGEKLLRQLYESGVVTDPADFYDLSMDELLRMERMGEVLATKLLRNVDGRKVIPLDVFLESLGIRELGRHAAKILAGFGTLKRVMSLSEEELSQIHTIGPIIAREVAKGLGHKRAFIDKLLKRVSIEKGKVAIKKKGPLTGKTFLFTGTLITMERSAAQKLVEEKGGMAALSVSKDLDYLVVGDSGGAGSKLTKAKKLVSKGGKVRIISEKEFLKMVK